MAKTRVLIVDDSAVIRRLLTEVLAAEPDLEVVGAAANGEQALEKLEQLKPDVITLDVEMPGKSGLEVLSDIRERSKVPVIMFSSLTQRAAATTLEALGRGASDYATKPTASSDARTQVREHLVPKIRALGPRQPIGPLPTRLVRARKRDSVDRPSLLVVGASTGGPNALAEVFRAFPSEFDLPILIVQHMPPVFTKLLADRLTASSKLPFHEARHGDMVQPGHAYIAPGDQHLIVARAGTGLVLQLNRAEAENSCRPSVDVLFRSVANAVGGGVLALVLTGMGQDGLDGCVSLHAKGAQIVVQDEASSVVWGMPGYVARAGLADATLPLSQLSTELLMRSRWGRVPLAPFVEGRVSSGR